MPTGVIVTANPSGLAAGSYKGTLTISAPTSSTIALSVQVAFTVTAAGQPSLSVKPGSVTFYTVLNSPAGTRNITVSNLGGGAIAFTARAATTSGGSWLSLSAATGTVNAFGSQSLIATLNPARLPSRSAF
jgi:hypothetical protein